MKHGFGCQLTSFILAGCYQSCWLSHERKDVAKPQDSLIEVATEGACVEMVSKYIGRPLVSTA
jgi:hypothetical protein